MKDASELVEVVVGQFDPPLPEEAAVKKHLTVADVDEDDDGHLEAIVSAKQTLR